LFAFVKQIGYLRLRVLCDTIYNAEQYNNNATNIKTMIMNSQLYSTQMYNEIVINCVAR
jgi:hypothetical protein